jgi:hypothetical protein
MALAPGDDAAGSTKLHGLADEPLAGLVGPGSLARKRGPRVGTHDVIVGGRIVGRTLDKMKTPGAKVYVTVMENATHAFDELEAREIRVRYDPEITARAQAMYIDYLKAAAKRHSSL